MPSPLAMQPLEERSEHNERENYTGFRAPIVPRVVEPVHQTSNQAENTSSSQSFGNFFNYMNSSMPIGSNPMYFNFFLPRQFL